MYICMHIIYIHICIHIHINIYTYIYIYPHLQKCKVQVVQVAQAVDKVQMLVLKTYSFIRSQVCDQATTMRCHGRHGQVPWIHQ